MSQVGAPSVMITTARCPWRGEGSGSARLALSSATLSGVPRISVHPGAEKWAWKSVTKVAPGSIGICGGVPIGSTRLQVLPVAMVGKKMAPTLSTPSMGVTAATMASSATCHLGPLAPPSGTVNGCFMLFD